MSDAAEMHCDAAPADNAEIGCKSCGYCFKAFTPRRHWAKWCSSACRNEANARKASTGMRGIVSSVRIMRRGSVSVVLRFGLEERERVLKLEPGKVVGVEVA